MNPSFRLTFFFSHVAGGQPLRCGALGRRDLGKRIGVRGKDQKRGEKLREEGVKEEGKRKGGGGEEQGEDSGEERGEGRERREGGQEVEGGRTVGRGREGGQEGEKGGRTGGRGREDRGERREGGQEEGGGSEHKVGVHLTAKSSSMVTYLTQHIEESRRDDVSLTIFGLAGEVPYSTIRPIVLPNLLIQLHPRPLASCKLSHTTKTDCPELQRRVKIIN